MASMSAELVSGSVNPETLYTKQQCIGGGSFGKVYKGIDRRTGNVVAIKVIDVENAEDEVDDIITEIAILSGMNSQYVTKYYGSYLHGSDLWIVMEFCSGGSCADLMKPGPISEAEIAVIIKELLNGLVYLHEDHKLHRDIKAANILVSANGQVKLADFGVSGQLSATMTKKNTFVGTPFWMAPEVIKQSGYDGKADIWSLGITALELANGEPPYADIHPMKVLFLIPKNPPPTLTGPWSAQFKDFVEQCLKKDPRERPTAKQLLQSPFIKKAGKPSRLTDLISRYQDWVSLHPKQEDEAEMSTPQKKAPVNEDLWDFGTVRPLKVNTRGCGPALSPMTAAGTNARNKSPIRKPVPISGGENINFETDETVRLASPQSPTKLATQIPLPPSPQKTSMAPLPLPPLPQTPRHRPLQADKSTVPELFNPQTPTKELPMTPQGTPALPPRRITPLSRDYEEYLQRTFADDLKVREAESSPRPAPYRPPPRSPRFDCEVPPSYGNFLGGAATEGVSGISAENKAPLASPLKNGHTRATDKNFPAIAGPVAGPRPLQQAPSLQPVGNLVAQRPLPAFNPSEAKLPAPLPSPAMIPNGHGESSVPLRNLTPLGSGLTTPLPPTPQHPPSVAESAWSRGTSVEVLPEITAIHGVIIPALLAATARRNHELEVVAREDDMKNGRKQPTQVAERRRLRTEAHENVRSCVRRLIENFEQLDRFDGDSPVGMGGDVTNFLEGFLEEILVRVEPSDDV
ncbi:Pkinase-domain-containing protein [Sporormia fimetaria CBS 119925]|uniref:non-specific serine/threonine protein kinase n=1 Tax=Sporormia fimetaria CBS 119925 TaxID=1340428 RepID=A0A6A6VJE4_9PLEO|nr:Pkinase-domain-containing protein [Sporormia fimetaria CBS 119925]